MDNIVEMLIDYVCSIFYRIEDSNVFDLNNLVIDYYGEHLGIVVKSFRYDDNSVMLCLIVKPPMSSIDDVENMALKICAKIDKNNDTIHEVYITRININLINEIINIVRDFQEKLCKILR